MTSGIVVTDHGFGDLARERDLAVRFGLHFTENACRDEDETAEAVRDARVVFVNVAPMTRAVLSGLPRSAAIVRYGVGVDNVDLDAARDLGVTVSNVPDYGAETVADHAVTLLLTLGRRIIELDADVRQRGWIDAAGIGSFRGFDETTVGLIGAGRIGRAVASRLRPFGVRVLAFDPVADRDELAGAGIELVDLDTVLAEAHGLSLHAPLIESTRGIIGAEAFRRMRDGAYIVNTSRGGLVDEAALVSALRSGKLAGAALDVFETEPLPQDSQLRTLPGVILTPHVGYLSDGSLIRLQVKAVEEAERSLRGEPLRYAIVG
jgi:D-3-phosphoglycerate dehydrogenase